VNKLDIKVRSLNKGEQYACDVKVIKRTFPADYNIHVSFGYLGRGFIFDNVFTKGRPQIDGLVISSFLINKRLKVIDPVPILEFYVIKDIRYNDRDRDLFVESILPKMHSWYREILSKSDVSIPGVEIMLIEWNAEKFLTHICRFK
jgi:hypothetical protein